MRRLISERRQIFNAQQLVRRVHTQTWELPKKLGKIIKLTPDQGEVETLDSYHARSLKQVIGFKTAGDKSNHVTLVLRGTVISTDLQIQKETIELFTRDGPPPNISQRVSKDLKPGHISLYYNDSYISHLPAPFRDQTTAIAADVRRAIADRHNTSFYIVQLNTELIDGFQARLNLRDLKLYHLKPTSNTDNCSSAIAKKITPKCPLEVLNINPIAAVRQMIVVLAQENDFHLDDSYAKLIKAVRGSGIARNLDEVARDEHVYTVQEKLSASSAVAPSKKGDDEKKEAEQNEPSATTPKPK